MQQQQIDDRLASDTVRISQIIVGAMISGVLVFLAVVLFGIVQQPKLDLPQLLFSYAAIAVLAVALLLSFAIPSWMVKTRVELIAADRSEEISKGPPPAAVVKQDLTRLLTLYQSKTIVANAVLEASAFFATYAYMWERQLFTIGLIVVSIAAMLGTMPTRSRVRSWLQTQQDRIDGMRQFGDAASL